MATMRKKLLFYIQPILPSYRKSLVDKFSECYDLTIFAGSFKKGDGFGESISEYHNFKLSEIVPLFGGRLIWQKGIIKALVMARPDIVLACANVRDLSFWISLIVCKIKFIPFYAHGQGLYRKREINFLTLIIYKLMFLMIEKYVSYTELSRISLINAGLDIDKIKVADNTIEFKLDAAIINKFGSEKGILFIGRLRDKCNLEVLVRSIKNLRDLGFDIFLHVIGGGEKSSFYRDNFNYDWIIYYGELFDEREILNISKTCRYGCYPGDAGLSIVHFFALKLPPIIHGDFSSHMGPEPSYISNNVNGFLYNNSKSSSDLELTIAKAMVLPESDYLNMSNSAFNSYINLKEPSLANKFCDILDKN